MLPKSQAGDAYSRAGTAIRDTRGDVTCTGRGFGKLIMYQFHLVLSATQRFRAEKLMLREWKFCPSLGSYEK